jgi:NTP pyrophosphatase (non-canonical NTP hydrolase)
MSYEQNQKSFVALESVRRERERQVYLWGEQSHDLCTWIAILTEEVGEAAKEAVDYKCKNPVKMSDGNRRAPTNEDQKSRLERLRKELVQVGAVAVQIIEYLDHYPRRS